MRCERGHTPTEGSELGSASVVLECEEAGTTRRLVFSGDIGRRGLPIIRDPQPPTGGADLVIMESTYGDREHEDSSDRALADVPVLAFTAASVADAPLEGFAGRIAKPVEPDALLAQVDAAVETLAARVPDARRFRPARRP